MGCGASAKKASPAADIQKQDGAQKAKFDEPVPVTSSSGGQAETATDKTQMKQSEQARDGAILIHSAKQLQNADFLLTGTSDPYAVCRFGRAGSAWQDKLSSTERRSDTALNDVNPVWRLVLPYTIEEGESAKTWELHLRVYDRDLVSADDILGELRVTLQELVGHQNELREYKLLANGDSSAGVVSMMAGTRVLEAMQEELQEAAEADKTKGWFGSWVRATKKLGQYFGDAIATPYYWANMARMLAVWSAAVGNDSDKSVEWFRRRTTDPKTGIDTYKWDGPDIQNSVTITGHPECSERLENLGSRCGTNDNDGEVFKPNYLGFNSLNNHFWPEMAVPSIGLGAPQEVHAFCRPLLVKLCGPGGKWSDQWLTSQARAFFAGRETVVVPDDLRTWNCQVLHQVFLGIEMPDSEAVEFMAWQKKSLIAIGTPEAALTAPGLSTLFDMEGCKKFKAEWMAKNKPLVKARLAPESAAWSETESTVMTSMVLDALLFAGGQSVPTVIQYGLAIPYSAWGQTNLPAGFSLDNSSTLPNYVWEVMRRFPPVSGFAYSERSFGSTPDQKVYLNLQLAQQDPRVWGGADSTKFVMRPLSEYHSKSVGFAEPAVAPKLQSANAHSCPAKDLAFCTIMAFLREFARTAENVEGGHRVLWKAVQPQDKERPPMKPEDIELSMMGTTRFTLHKDAAVLAPPETRTAGAHLLDKLSEEERQLMRIKNYAHNKMQDIDVTMVIWTKIVQLTINPGFEDTSAVVGPPKIRNFSSEDFYTAPFGGLRFLINGDEDKPPPRFNALKTMVFDAALGILETDDTESTEKDLIWFDSREEAVTCMDIMFGECLPPSFNVHEDMATDAGMRSLCVFGVGSWYLTPVKSISEVGHEVPEGALFECNIEYLGKYETRSNWITNGHTLYLGAPKEGDVLPGALLAIWSCHHNKLFVHGDALWEHAKAGFRSSLCTSLTLREHLFTCHWVIANGLMLAARETLNKDHPLRRLLKQFYYGTADINEQAKQTLLPPGHLGHRTFAFTNSSWVTFFNDLCGAWKWVPFPERMKQTGLSPEVLGALPLRHDGELFWRVCEKYVKNYLRLFYPSDDSVAGDAEVVAFWASFEVQFGTPWQLPALSFDSLVCLVTDLIWWVTGGHEYVGSIVEYLTALSGCQPKIADGKDVPDVQTFTQAMIIIALTGMKQPPLMDEWTHLFEVSSWTANQHQDVLDVVRQFQSDLASCSDEIEHQNMLRERRGDKKCVAFNPRILETSVSI